MGSDREPEQPAVDEDDERQVTEQGYEIPVPSRDDFFGNLDKISRPEE